MEQQQPSALLRWEEEGKAFTHPIRSDEVSMGRKHDCDLVLESPNVSREHAVLSYVDGSFFVKDLDSSYGTRLNEQMLKPFVAYQIKSGDEITVGRCRLLFMLEGDDVAPAPEDLHTLELDFSNSDLLALSEQFRKDMLVHFETILADDERRAPLEKLFDSELEKLNTYVEERFKEYEVLQEITQIIVGILDVHELLATVLKLASRVLHADRGFILLYDAKNDDLRSMVTRHFERGDRMVHQHDFQFSQTIARSCYKKREMIIIEDAMQDEHFQSADSIVASSIRSVVCLPLIKGEQVSGVIYLDNLSTPGCFSEKQTNFLNAFAAQTALALDNARLYTQAVTDGLTKLYNRKFIDERIAEEMVRARRYSRACSLILLDVDFFKKVNDTHGHTVGDQVLQTVAHCLRESARGSDIVARYGGEEFLMLLTETDLEGAVIFAERLRQAVEALEIRMDKKTIQVTVSCGVTGYRREFRSSVKRFVEETDKQLYRAKDEGRNRVCSPD